ALVTTYIYTLSLHDALPIFYLNRTGTPWRDLPVELGDWDVVYMRFRRWSERGIWMRLWKNMQTAPFADARELLLDSTTVRAKGRSEEHTSELQSQSNLVCRL